jgi:hypothetical protein
MGITAAQASLLLEARGRGTAFDKVVTIGRQTNYLGSASADLMRRFPGLASIDASILAAEYADPFFVNVLGARRVDSIDISNYEGATILHDMNVPIPKIFHGQYDAVIESGSLEHVFNFPVALFSCMKLLKLSGSLFLSLPINNFAGHGFYQFSPELFFRVFSAQNGFELKAIVLGESWLAAAERGIRFPLYRPVDPAGTGGRVNLVTSYPTFALVHAVRTGDLPDTISAQQSDYAVAWSRAQGDSQLVDTMASRKETASVTSILRLLARRALGLMPRRCELWLRARYERYFLYSLRRKRLFVPTNVGHQRDPGEQR